MKIKKDAVVSVSVPVNIILEGVRLRATQWAIRPERRIWSR